MMRILALTLGVAALMFGFVGTDSSASVSEVEAAALVGGGCTHSTKDVKCHQLKKNVVSVDGDVVEVNCPYWPETFRQHVKSDKGIYKKPETFIATCLGCGKFYKKVKCNPDVIDPT